MMKIRAGKLASCFFMGVSGQFFIQICFTTDAAKPRVKDKEAANVAAVKIKLLTEHHVPKL